MSEFTVGGDLQDASGDAIGPTGQRRGVQRRSRPRTHGVEPSNATNRRALVLVPLLDKDVADAFIDRIHRHHDPLDRVKFSVGVTTAHGRELVGVAQVGTPVARPLDDDFTFEVRRVPTDGTPNACSILYAACAGALEDLGAKRVLTYTLLRENGSSLRGAGWYMAASDLTPVKAGEEQKAVVRPRGWGCQSRPRPRERDLFGEECAMAQVEREPKVRWAKALTPGRRRKR